MLPRQIPTSLLFTLILLASFFLTVQAQEVPAEGEESSDGAAVQISLRPKEGIDGDRFRVEVEPGSSAELVAVMQNFGSDPIELRTFTSDVVPMINGGLGMEEMDEAQEAPTTWMDYSTEEKMFASHEAVEKPFNISVPEGTPPGEYINAIVLETVNPIPTDEASSFDQYFRKIVAVYIVVPGEMEPDFAYGSPSAMVQGTSGWITVPLTNTGNVRLDLLGWIKVTTLDGEVILDSQIVLGPVYGWQETAIQFGMPVTPTEGEYLVSVELTDQISDISMASGEMNFDMPAADESGVQPVAFENVVIEANADPIQFANVAMDVSVTGATYRSTRLTMSVSRDGGFVEDFVLADSLALSGDMTAVQQRYLPLTGWESGTYTFSITLEDTSSGGAIEIYSEDDVATLEVP